RRPELQLVIAGGGRGDYEQKMRALVERLGLGKRVCFTGRVDELAPYYAASRLVVIPSLSEGIPITLMEALALERPVVCSLLRGTHEFASEIPSIRWARPGDSGDLARAIEASLDHPPDTAPGLALALEHSWDKVVTRYLKVYEEASGTPAFPAS
ncbi:MAG: glycosyltransferase family 4 protein, partial [Planctomycetes bacterium]|nr:glycosyltransferase family 4 protein [Planctomycetota bacterium]